MSSPPCKRRTLGELSSFAEGEAVFVGGLLVCAGSCLGPVAEDAVVIRAVAGPVGGSGRRGVFAVLPVEPLVIAAGNFILDRVTDAGAVFDALPGFFDPGATRA